MKSRVCGGRAILSTAVLLFAIGLPFVSPAQNGCAPAPAGLVSWWPGEGSTVDIFGSNPGTAWGGVGYAPGEVGNALVLGGSGAHVRVADAASLRLTRALALEAWVSPTLGARQAVLAKWDTSAGTGQSAYQLSLDSLGHVCLSLNASGNDLTPLVLASTNTVAGGSWTHIAATYDGTNALVLINGAVAGAATWGFGVFPGADDLAIGGVVGGALPGVVEAAFTGLIDEASVYARALAPGEIQAIYLAGAAGKCRQAPAIVTQPSGGVVAPGGNITLSVAATGAPVLGYQWTWNGAVLPGGTNPALALSNLQPANSGSYAVVVSNWVGSVTSATAVLTVAQAPSILGLVPPQTVAVGSTAVLWVAAGGTAPLGYQWLFDQALVPGATANSLVIAPVQPADAGNYSVVVSNAAGSVTSSATALVVGVPPAITSNPTNLSVTVGSSATFTAAATGTAPLTWQWWLGGGPIAAANGPSLTLASVSVKSAGQYWVTVSNQFGMATSAAAQLTVQPPPPPALINVNFASSSHYTGYAAFGLATNDYWNNYYAPYAASAGVANLIAANGAATTSGFVVTNGAGHWSFSSPNAMFSTYAYSQNNGNITVNVTNLASGTYDFYLYGHASVNSANTVFELAVGGNDYGLKATASDSSWNQAQWLEGGQYVAFRSVSVTNGGAPVLITAHPGVGGYSQINGMQIALSQPTAPSFTLQPASQSAAAGATVTFLSLAVGSAPISYQWSFGGVPLPGATGARLSLTNVQPASAGPYSVTASNLLGAVSSSNAVLTVNLGPAITAQPLSQTVAAGAAATFTVTASGTAPLGYQWTFDGTNIAGATASSLVLSGATLANQGSYSVVVSNLVAAVTSSAATLVVQTPPYIVTQPVSSTVWAGSTAVFSVGASGSSPLGYQWLLGGVPVSGANAAVLSIPNVAPAQAGAWSVIVSNAFGSVQSAVATLNVSPVVQPALVNVDIACNLTYSGPAAFGLGTNDFWNNYYAPWQPFAALQGLLAADGTPTPAGLTVQNGAGHWGFTDANLMYSTYCYAQDFGNVTVTVTNLPGGVYDIYLYGHGGADNANTVFELSVGASDYGLQSTATNSIWSLAQWVEGAQYVVFRGVSVTNGGAPVVVVAHPGLSTYTQVNGIQIARSAPAAPALTLQPSSQTVAVGATVTFQSAATGSIPLAYQWSFDGTNLPGATSASLSLTNVQAANAGAYAVTVTNSLGEAVSSNAVLTIDQPPMITGQPQSQSVAAGATATFAVIASGAAPLGYQWSWNGTNLPGATASSLVLASAQLGNQGAYAVIVTNLVGAATSATASLIVRAPPVIVTQPQAVSTTTGATVSLSVAATGTGPLSYQWWKGGTLISGAISASLVMANVTTADAGGYSVVVTNLFGSVQSATALVTVTAPTPASLLNVNFGAAGAYLGYAAYGQSANDYWNGYYAPYALVAAVPNLKGADDTATSVGVTIQDGGGDWSFSSPNAMFSTYCYPQDSGSVVVTVTNLPGGVYDFYLYGHAGADGANTVFELAVGGNDAGLKPTASDSTWSAAQWIEGAQYVVYRSVSVTNGGAPVVVTAHPGVSGYSQINGMQIVSRAPQAPALTLQPVSQSTVLGATVSFPAVATGTAPLAFQWSFQGTNLPWATNATLVLTNVQFANAGSYAVTVTNAAGTAASSNAVLTVGYPPALVQAGSLSVAGAGAFTLPVSLVANGNENALGFTLDFDPTLLTYTALAAGSNAPGISLLRNTNQAGAGLLAVGLALPAGQVFSAGTQQVVLVSFTAAPVGVAANTTVSFGGQLTSAQLSDPLANSLPVTFAPGTVSISRTMLEGDIAPRPDGDGQVTVTDWVLEGRYVAQLDWPTNASEFERADCAPRATLGDGQITVADWVQVGRYAAGLDPVTPAGGPTNEVPVGGGGVVISGPRDQSPRAIFVNGLTLGPGQSGTALVELAALGDENALGFTLAFNPAVVSFTGATLASGASSATLNVNTRQAGAGIIGFALALGWGDTFPATNLPVVQVAFSTALKTPAVSCPLALTDQIVQRQVVDPNAAILLTTYVNGTATVLGPPSLRIAVVTNGVALSWPGWATNFVPQRATGDLAHPLAWTDLPNLPTNGVPATSAVVPAGATNTWFRLRSK